MQRLLQVAAIQRRTFDENNYVTPNDRGGFDVYVDGQFLGGYTSQQDAERAYNDYQGGTTLLLLTGISGVLPAQHVRDYHLCGFPMPVAVLTR